MSRDTMRGARSSLSLVSVIQDECGTKKFGLMELFDVDADILSERILQDLQATFKKDPLIDEFDVLPVNSTCNKCPVIHVEHKVALESWCVRHLYLYVYTKFMKWKKHSKKIDPSSLLSWTSTILLINPNVETAWNTRKELIQLLQHLPSDELKFAEIVLSRKPKSTQTFAHRRWILLHLMENNVLRCTIQQLIEKELCLCMQTCSKISNNYYAWSHRMWVIEKLAHFCLKIIFEELNTTRQWVTAHVSDHSGFQYRQFLLRNIIHGSSVVCSLQEKCKAANNELENRCSDEFSNEVTKNYKYCDLLMNELNLLSDLQYSFPGHETLWNHRRFIIHCIITFHIDAKTSSLITKFPVLINKESDISHKKCKFEFECYMDKFWNSAKEENFILHCLQNGKDKAWESNLIYRHQKWLEKVVCQTN